MYILPYLLPCSCMRAGCILVVICFSYGFSAITSKMKWGISAIYCFTCCVVYWRALHMYSALHFLEVICWRQVSVHLELFRAYWGDIFCNIPNALFISGCCLPLFQFLHLSRWDCGLCSR